MSAWTRMTNCLTEFGVPFWAFKNPMDTPLNKYIVFRADSDNPDLYADDALEEESTDFTINLFSKSDFTNEKQTLKRLLTEYEFTVTNTVYFYESETGYYHVAIECNGGDV